MGLDTIELVMEVEETFNIDIPDEAAAEMMTVGELYEFIVKHIELSDHDGQSVANSTFDELCQSLSKLGVGKTIKPADRVDSVFPSQDRKAFWQQLEAELDLRLPSLVRPKLIVYLSILPVAIACLYTAVVAYQMYGPHLLVGVYVLLAAIFSAGILAVATSPWATQYSSKWPTVEDLTTRVIYINAVNLTRRHEPISRADVWGILRELIVHQLGVDRDEVTKEANFVTDLGCE